MEQGLKNAVADKDFQRPLAWALLGDLESLKSSSEGRTYYETAIAHDPDCLVAWTGLNQFGDLPQDLRLAIDKNLRRLGVPEARPTLPSRPSMDYAAAWWTGANRPPVKAESVFPLLVSPPITTQGVALEARPSDQDPWDGQAPPPAAEFVVDPLLYEIIELIENTR
jgi:hypothetical protein